MAALPKLEIQRVEHRRRDVHQQLVDARAIEQVVEAVIGQGTMITTFRR